MKIGTPREVFEGESRVAMTPDSALQLQKLGFDCVVETGAGSAAGFSDEAYVAAGVEIAATAAALWKTADVVAKVRPPNDTEAKRLKKSQTLISFFWPAQNEQQMGLLAKKGTSVIAMDMVPRISRAQSMDVLSSQSSLTGYKAVIDGAANYGKAMPMLMTAAGRINPAKVFVMGAGVAGLQAIATARRLGAIVSATDVRAASREEVQSLGASFIMVETDEGETGQTAGGYAKEMSEDYKRRQAELIADHIKDQDIVITTALIPGRPAPILVNDDMIASMKPGAVIVDITAEQGGNVSQTRPGEIHVTGNGVKILAEYNLPSRLATDSSALYARNLMNFVELLVNLVAVEQGNARILVFLNPLCV